MSTANLRNVPVLSKGGFCVKKIVMSGVYLSISFRGIRGDTSICESKECFTANLYLRELSNPGRRR